MVHGHYYPDPASFRHNGPPGRRDADPRQFRERSARIEARSARSAKGQGTQRQGAAQHRPASGQIDRDRLRAAPCVSPQLAAPRSRSGSSPVPRTERAHRGAERALSERSGHAAARSSAAPACRGHTGPPGRRDVLPRRYRARNARIEAQSERSTKGQGTQRQGAAQHRPVADTPVRPGVTRFDSTATTTGFGATTTGFGATTTGFNRFCTLL